MTGLKRRNLKDCFCLWLYNKLWNSFDEIDTGDDRRIDRTEFKVGLHKLGIKLSPSEASDEFNKIDDGGGQILFDEFCDYCIGMLDGRSSASKSGTHRTTLSSEKNNNPAYSGGGDESIPTAGGDESAPAAQPQDPNHAAAFVSGFSMEEAKKKCAAVFDKNSIKALWNRLDCNGNNIVSLAEVDKMVCDLARQTSTMDF